MAKIIAITNQKGGVGKSTTAVNLGAALARSGSRVLVVDVDPQGNTTSGLGVSKSTLECCIYDVLLDQCPPGQAIRKIQENLDILPATLRLAGAEIEMVSVVAREQRLARALTRVESAYDKILLDCPPSLGILTMNALSAATEVLVPIQCEFYALEGITQLMNVVELVTAHVNPALRIGGVLLTLHDSRLNLSEQVAEEVRRHFGERVFTTVIPRNVKLAEAPSFGQSVLDYDFSSRGAQAYLELAREVLAREKAGSGARLVGALAG
ncbi:MAG: chromosome partitioning protein [Candidatus Xenobia bacterium]